MSATLKGMGVSLQTAADIQERAMSISRYNAEVIDGEPVEKPWPIFLHQIIQQRIQDLLRGQCPDIFRVFQQLDCRFGADLRIPDIVVVSPSARYEKGILLDSPALVVEILSPGQTVAQLYSKCLTYLQHGVPACWVIEPRQRRVSVCLPDIGTSSTEKLAAFIGDREATITPEELFSGTPIDAE